MKFAKFILFSAFTTAVSPAVFAQVSPNNAPPPAVRSTTKLSDILAQNLEKSKQTEISRERREQSYAKLLEAQRYLWLASPARGQNRNPSGAVLAKQALQKAVELNPNLAEGYTALAELAITMPPSDVDEAITLVTIATKLDPNNFGGHRIMARLYTFKSGLSGGVADPVFTQKAIAEWKEVARLDARNAEAWAFLSALYEKTNNAEARVEALKNWVSSAAPIDSQFYRRVMGGQETLSPENATMKLGGALLKAGKTREALEIISQMVADEPDNAEAVEMLREAVVSGDAGGAAIAAESLRQAVYANPDNPALLVLLAETQVRAGKFEEASKGLQAASDKLAESDKISAANLQVALGDLMSKANRTDEAIAAYRKSLVLRGITNNEAVSDEERDFVISVFEKMIQTFKNANRPNDVKSTIERARQVLGKSDLFADRQTISFYRESGMKPEALAAVRALRAKYPDDYGTLRLEASILTENGKVDEAVALVKSLIKKKTINTGTSGQGNNNAGQTFSALPVNYDDFTNYLFISNLYSQANRGKEAIESANLAFAAAQGEERRQIARLTLATAQQMSGDFDSAEATLREILRQTPDNPIALNNLGYFLIERDKNINEAYELIKQAVKIDPTNPSYLDSLGWAYYKLGKYAEAEQYLKEAAGLDSGSSTINEHLGDVYQKQGKTDLARTAWRKALNLASDASEVNRLKGKLGIKDGR